MSDAHLSQLTFDSLNIPESLKRGIAELGYHPMHADPSANLAFGACRP